MLQVLHDYLAALDAGSAERATACFTSHGIVRSPLYGVRAARDFYAELFADSAPSATELRRVFVDPDDPREVALAFRYAWTLRDGTPAPFDVVDLITLTADRTRMSQLSICYDTAPLRAAWGAATGRDTSRA